MQDQFIRTELLLGKDAMRRLAASRVAVFGLGGVGGHAAEALARSGVGALDLIDNDRISPSNINRQLFATGRTVGRYKVHAAAERLRDIAPHIRLRLHTVFYTPETADRFDFSEYDYIIDAIDTVAGKIALAVNAKSAGTPLISAMGAGNKLDPTAFEVADIYSTSVCPLARVMRHELRQRGIDSLKVVYSKEPPIVPRGEAADKRTDAPRKQTPGSTAFVPPVVGLILAGEVVKDLIAPNADLE